MSAPVIGIKQTDSVRPVLVLLRWSIQTRHQLTRFWDSAATWPWWSDLLLGAVGAIAPMGEYAIAVLCLVGAAFGLLSKLLHSNSGRSVKVLGALGIMLGLSYFSYVVNDNRGHQPWSHLSSPARGLLLTYLRRPLPLRLHPNPPTYPPDMTKLLPSQTLGGELEVKSTLVMHAFPTGTYGPTHKFTTVDLDVNNASEDAIVDLDITMKVIPSRPIVGISQMPSDAGDCTFSAVPLPDDRVVIDGQDKREHLTLDSQDILSGQSGLLVVFRERLKCLRISGHATARFQVAVNGDAQNDALLLSGRYQLEPSKGSAVVNVNETIPIK